MAKDRYTEERDKQEDEKKATTDPVVINGPAGDMVEIEPNVFTNVDPDIYDDGSNDSVVSEGINFDALNLSGSGLGFDTVDQVSE